MDMAEEFDITMKQLYKKIGGNYSAAMERLGNDERIAHFMKYFLEDKSYERLKEAYASNDENVIYDEVNTFVEVCKTLSLDKLAETGSVIMEAYRPENSLNRAYFHVSDLFDVLGEQYCNAITEIKKELNV